MAKYLTLSVIRAFNGQPQGKAWICGECHTALTAQGMIERNIKVSEFKR